MGAILSLISSRGFIAVNKQLAQMYGLDEAIMLGELASEYEYWEARGEVENGYFYSTVENVRDNTTLSEKKQRNAIKTLKDAGIVDVVIKGLPPKRYFKIDESALFAQLNASNEPEQSRQNGGFNTAEMPDLIPSKRQTNKNKENNNKKENNNENKKDIYTRICSRLNEKAGTNYRPTSKATQRHINARLAEGFTVDDFIKVIDVKCAEWAGTDMGKYLRPETLFGSKFENYLNQQTKQQKSGQAQSGYWSSRAKELGVEPI